MIVMIVVTQYNFYNGPGISGPSPWILPDRGLPTVSLDFTRQRIRQTCDLVTCVLNLCNNILKCAVRPYGVTPVPLTGRLKPQN